MLPGKERQVLVVPTARITMACSSYEPAQNTESFSRTPSFACRSERRPPGCILGRVGDTCWTMSSSGGETSGTCCNELAQRLANLPVVDAAAADENASMENGVNSGTQSSRRRWPSSVAQVRIRIVRRIKPLLQRSLLLLIN
nr:unnamed protein product [Spirometra erinaceieuropaei]